ncbi:MAG: SURF1 family protein [Acidobacteria bacterium]|nr:SURF1 family protein [Acidobacteriota bacterium]
MLKTALKPRWIAALILALVVSGLFVLLSQWQFSRSTQTTMPPPAVTETYKPLVDTFVPGSPMPSKAEDQLVSATGHFDASRQVIVPDRLQDGQSGYWVVTAFVVDGAPVLKGVAATDYTIIPVARGWVSDPAQAAAPPSGSLELKGRLIPAEAPNPKPNMPQGQVAAVSSAELVNVWKVSSYAGFVISFHETSGDKEVSATVSGPMKTITVTAQDQGNKINWLNIFYAVEWVVFAGFAVFLWWRLVADDYRRANEIDEIDEEVPGDR